MCLDFALENLYIRRLGGCMARRGRASFMRDIMEI